MTAKMGDKVRSEQRASDMTAPSWRDPAHKAPGRHRSRVPTASQRFRAPQRQGAVSQSTRRDRVSAVRTR